MYDANLVGPEDGAVISGALAAAVTPLRSGGTAVDDEAVGPLVDFLVAGGLDGLLAMGSTGEGILLTLPERKRLTDLFVAACAGRLDAAVHCGAQTTADTVVLAEHAAASGASAVAVIGPPYFRLDDESLVSHFAAAARACAPTPFYVYEFAAVSGYAIPVGVVQRLRDEAPNLAGLKVSDAPFERVAPYLLDGLDIFVGAECLISAGMRHGAAGAVSALASAFPELVAAAVRDPSTERSDQLGELRVALDRFPRHAALKRILAVRGVAIGEAVRPPLRGLADEEREAVDVLAETWLSKTGRPGRGAA
jgi:dihydrodipicolinate synthase/N-acetylneuraminate lyase